jgi:predicted nucleotidyltransferase component of viral defense system
MTDEIKNLPASIHGRLRNKARERGRPFQEILQYYANERFLYRLAQSKHAQKFVLKGALIFFAWGIPLERPTRDIDLRGFTQNTLANLTEIIQEICIQPVEPDGMTFDPNSVAGETTLEGANYEGLRLRFWGYLGEARVRMIIDLGFADPITPSQTVLQFPTILDMPAPILQGYPPETVIAEKLESMVSLGMINSRMKDFYDIWEISRRFDFEGRILQEAIAQTFTARNTLIPQEIPVALSDTFVQEKEALWEAFLNRINPERSVQLESVIADLTALLFPVLQATAEGAQFSLNWGAGKTWKE